MKYINYKPPISLQPYIDRYWRCNSEGESIQLLPLFAGTGLDLFIHFSTPFHITEGILSTSHIFCPRKPISISSDNNLDFISIRFRSGAFRHFCSLKFNDFCNNFLSSKDIWGNEGAEFIDRLHDTLSWNRRIEILNSFLLKQFMKHQKFNPLLDNSIACIYTNYQHTPLNLFAKKYNISFRHFERLFKDEFNISPKKFQIASRFQTSIKEILLSSSNDYLQIAINNGYYDQSHFIKECKSLSGMSPLEIMNMKNISSHFYFESLSRSKK
ncbi:helix-turn-helix transcriptional regulator [Dysgonomonas capnocytophagoides]|uniref:helix-turn-helix transcriptional regulator n=1 Tax=Dysgonomonas capnocytophagoides TaxID=45254 RepID=UPI0030C7DBFA